MNKRIAEPLIVNFMGKTEDKQVTQNGRRIYVPLNAPWPNFTAVVNSAIHNNAYDSVIVHIDKGIDFTEKGTANNVTIKMNQVCKAATDADKAVLNDASKDTWYFMNPSWHEQFNAHGYAPSDESVLSKFHSYGDEAAWQKHQSEVWARMADMMPLSAKAVYGTPNHVAQLTDPKRGLEKKDLSGFWSFKSNRLLSPAVMGDDMVGMPGVEGRDYDGFVIVTSAADGTASERPLSVRSLKTVGMSGAAIPMANAQGYVPKYQIATDPSKINVALKARAADGVSVQKSEYFNKKTNVFTFTFTDGRQSNLKVVAATETGDVKFSDAKGTFDVHMKDDIYPLLVSRGYDLPPIIATLKVEPSAKYIWQSRGTMVGSEAVTKVVSPSNAGFLIGREPKNGADDYIVLVAEGALKGHIVAKYCDVKDREGGSFGDFIAKDHGIIVAQVPGVSRAFVESVKPVYDAYKVTGTYIAMDADGRENLVVANGIDEAYHCLSGCSPVRVMSWNPAQKGLDDALLAVAQGQITLTDMGLRFGPPEKLFPKDAAKAPNPYHLDGTRTYKQERVEEYAKSSADTNAKIKAMQDDTVKRATAPNSAATQQPAPQAQQTARQPVPQSPQRTAPQQPVPPSVKKDVPQAGATDKGAKPPSTQKTTDPRIKAIQDEIRRRAAELAAKNPKKNVSERANAMKASGPELKKDISSLDEASKTGAKTGGDIL